MRLLNRVLFTRIAWALLLTSAPVLAQGDNATQCATAREAEKNKHLDALAEIQKREVDVENEYSKGMIACAQGDRACPNRVSVRRKQQMDLLAQDRSDENARWAKANIDIGRGHCTATSTTANVTPPEKESPILATGDKARIFKLGAEMNVIKEEMLAKHDDPLAEFVGGLGDWANETLKMLAQKPGVPLQQMAEGIVKYLTNDNAKNHRALMKAAKQGLAEFKKNPARFVGQQLPNVLPIPESLGKLGALRQLGEVENAAAHVKTLAATVREVDAGLEQIEQSALKFGDTPGTNPCFKVDACFGLTMADLELRRTKGPYNGLPYKIAGASAHLGENGLTLKAAVEDQLKARMADFKPNNPASFTPDQITLIAEGKPFKLPRIDDAREILKSEGPGSLAAIFGVPHYTPTMQAAGEKFIGHVFSGHNDNKIVSFTDASKGGIPAKASPREYQYILYYPYK